MDREGFHPADVWGCFLLSKKNHVPISEGLIREGGFDSSVNEPPHCMKHRCMLGTPPQASSLTLTIPR